MTVVRSTPVDTSLPSVSIPSVDLRGAGVVDAFLGDVVGELFCHSQWYGFVKSS